MTQTEQKTSKSILELAREHKDKVLLAEKDVNLDFFRRLVKQGRRWE